MIYKEEINLEKGFQSFKIPIEHSSGLINKKNKNNFFKSDNGNYFLNKGEYILNLDQISKNFKNQIKIDFLLSCKRSRVNFVYKL